MWYMYRPHNLSVHSTRTDHTTCQYMVHVQTTRPVSTWYMYCPHNLSVHGTCTFQLCRYTHTHTDTRMHTHTRTHTHACTHTHIHTQLGSTSTQHVGTRHLYTPSNMPVHSAYLGNRKGPTYPPDQVDSAPFRSDMLGGRQSL